MKFPHPVGLTSGGLGVLALVLAVGAAACGRGVPPAPAENAAAAVESSAGRPAPPATSSSIPPAAPATAESAWALVGGTVIDATGRPPLPDGVILISGNRIVAVGARGRVALPPDARVVDASGLFVIPGLMDANVHLVMRRGRPDVIDRYEALIEEAAQTALKNGQTTVFDTWGVLQPLLNVRDRIARGEVEGSRLFVAGHCIGLAGPLPPGSPAASLVESATADRINALAEENVGTRLRFMTPDQVKAEIRAYIARGVDFLKYASSGWAEPDLLVFSEAVQKVIVEEGHRAGLTVQAHTTSNESLRLAIEAGVDLLTHADVTGPIPIPASTLSRLAEKQIPCGFFPKTARRWRIELEAGARTPGAKTLVVTETLRANQLALRASGVPFLIATDGGLWPPDILAEHPAEHWLDYEAVIGEGYFVRCRGMADMGFSGMEILQAGTRNVARAYGLLDRLGTLEPGKLADLVVLDADPLRDIDNLRAIRMVVKGGAIVDRDALPRNRIFYPGFDRRR